MVRTWGLVVSLVTLAHAAAWYGLGRLQDSSTPSRPLTVIEATLLPPPPAPAPQKLAPPPPAPPKPQPKPREKPRTQPKPLFEPQLVAEQNREPVAEQIPEPVAPPVSELPPSPAPEPVVEAPRFNAAYLNNPPPAYPFTARRQNQEGRVMVRAQVLADGSCSRVELKQTSGYDLLDQAALAAVRKWRFVPARKGNQTITAWVEVPITFKLEN